MANKSSGSKNGARRSSGSGGRAKGQMKPGKAVQYSIKGKNGETKYIGTTNNPTRRTTEHRESGKLGQGDKLVVETRAVSRKSAGRVEAAKLASHRRKSGSNPKHNTTKDGKFRR